MQSNATPQPGAFASRDIPRQTLEISLFGSSFTRIFPVIAVARAHDNISRITDPMIEKKCIRFERNKDPDKPVDKEI